MWGKSHPSTINGLFGKLGVKGILFTTSLATISFANMAQVKLVISLGLRTIPLEEGCSLTCVHTTLCHLPSI
jgi:hypothetical protein